MKKLIALLSIAGMLTFGLSNAVVAQDTEATDTEMTTDTTATEEIAETPVMDTMGDETEAEAIVGA